MRKHVTDYSLYRWRYGLGFVFVVVLIGILITVASVYVPGALRAGEISSSLQSGTLSIQSIAPSMVVDLPYHILQRLSFTIFGVTTISIKFPSIILGSLTALGIYLLIGTWFRRNIAILTTILSVSCAPFLFMMQDGTPNIMYSFLTIWILFAATYVTRKKLFGTFWKVLTGVLMAAALYTPLGIYLVLAVLTTAIFHPHIRYTILRFSRPRLWIALILGLVSLIPLVYASLVDRNTLLMLLGVPTDTPDIKQNLIHVASDVFGLFGGGTDYLIHPLYSLGFVLLAAIGVYKLVTYKYTARSYITLTLSVFTIPLIIFNPIHIMYLFPLAVLMLALGIATLISDWYKLFPRNPYARVTGLVPLSLVILGITFTGISRYMDNYTYNSGVLSSYSNDLRLLGRHVTALHGQGKLSVVVDQSELPFYSMVAHYDKRYTATASLPQMGGTSIVSRAAFQSLHPTAEPLEIVTNRFSDNADRFYIYKS